jgi:hypothetical protein
MATAGTFNNATPRALVYLIAGHEQHRIHFIKENYLKTFFFINNECVTVISTQNT